MTETETIWMSAREDLLVREGVGPYACDAIVRDHSLRVARTALLLAEMPELATQRIDRLALLAGGLYHDAGWIVDFQEKRIGRRQLLESPTSDVQRERGAVWMSERLTEELEPASLTTAATAIRTCNLKEPESAEAKLIADAENLDEIGPLAIRWFLRRFAQGPEGMNTVIEAWHRQQEYNFWPARIKDCFHFARTRKLAHKRFAQLESFLYALTVCHRGEDVAELLESLNHTLPAVPTMDSLATR